MFDQTRSIVSNDQQFDAAEDAAFRAIELITERGSQSLVCESYRVLGNIHRSKGETEKAIRQYEVAFKIASSSNWDGGLLVRFTTPWRGYFTMKAGSAMHKLTSNAPSYTQPIAHITWVV